MWMHWNRCWRMHRSPAKINKPKYVSVSVDLWEHTPKPIYAKPIVWWMLHLLFVAGKCAHINAESVAVNKTIANGCNHRSAKRCRSRRCSHEIYLSRLWVTVGRFQCPSIAMAWKGVRAIRCRLHYTCANLYEPSVGATADVMRVVAIKVIFVWVRCVLRMCACVCVLHKIHTCHTSNEQKMITF